MNIDKGLALHNTPTGVETVKYDGVSPTTFPQKEYTTYAKLTRKQRRKMLAHVTKTAPLKRMTYAQARLYHRLRGRL